MTLKSRKKETHFIVHALESDIDADYLIWKNEIHQQEYLEKIASQIGWIIIEFNKLEWQLTEVLKQYFCDSFEELSAIYYELISSKNFASKVDLLKNFYKVYGNGSKKNIFETDIELQNWDKKVDILIDQLKQSSEIRNKYAHCFWHRLEETKYVEFKSKINPKQGLNIVFIKFDEYDLKYDLEKISDLEVELFNIDSIFNEAYSNT